MELRLSCTNPSILWPSYHHNGISYTGKTTPLYWDRALVSYCSWHTYLSPDNGTSLALNRDMTLSYDSYKKMIETIWKPVALSHDDIIKWKHFLCYWPFVSGIHQSLVDSPHKGQWHGALIFSLVCIWRNSWVNNQDAGDLKCSHAHYDIIVIN